MLAGILHVHGSNTFIPRMYALSRMANYLVVTWYYHSVACLPASCMRAQRGFIGQPALI